MEPLTKEERVHPLQLDTIWYGEYRWVRVELYDAACAQRDHYKAIAELNAETIKSMAAARSAEGKTEGKP